MMAIKSFQITSGDAISFDYLFVQQNFESCFVFGQGAISDDSKMARRPQGKFYFFVKGLDICNVQVNNK